MTLVAAIVLVFAASLVGAQADSTSRCGRRRRPVAMPADRVDGPQHYRNAVRLGLGRPRGRGNPRLQVSAARSRTSSSNGDIGGYFDPNFEAILALKPDLVVMLEEQSNSLPAFERLKLETLVVCHKTTDGIIESFRTIGRVCGKGPEGRQMAARFQESGGSHSRGNTRAYRARGCSLCSIGPMAAAIRPTSTSPADDDYIDRSSSGPADKTPTSGAASATPSFRPKASCG